MVKVDKGVLVKCDSTMKEFLLYLNDIGELGGKFVIVDLDETHLFIETDYVERLKEKIDDLMERLTYTPDK